MKAVLTSEDFYIVIGVIFLRLGRVARGARSTSPSQRRSSVAAFWGLLAVTYLFGPVLSPLVVGYLLLAMVALAAAGKVVRSTEQSTTREERTASAAKLKNRLFWPALVVPALAVIGSLVLGRLHFGLLPLVDPKQVTVIALGLGAVVALSSRCASRGRKIRCRPRPGKAAGCLQAIGWALILPQLLAALGGIFGAAKVGDVVAQLTTQLLPVQFPFVAVLAYTGGMALFTICMGNAFAAFPVMTLVRRAAADRAAAPRQHRDHGGALGCCRATVAPCSRRWRPTGTSCRSAMPLELEGPHRGDQGRRRRWPRPSLRRRMSLLMYFLRLSFLEMTTEAKAEENPAHRFRALRRRQAESLGHDRARVGRPRDRGSPRSCRAQCCRASSENRRAELKPRSPCRHRPALVICLGLANGRPGITPERVAINVDDARIPDNAGRQPVDRPVVRGGPAAYWSTLPIKAIVEALRRNGIPAAVSQTAGTFVCNHVFYALMHELRAQPTKFAAGSSMCCRAGANEGQAKSLAGGDGVRNRRGGSKRPCACAGMRRPRAERRIRRATGARRRRG